MTAPAPMAPGMDGLRTDQAPPLAIPASFFGLAPLGMIAAGALLAWGAEGVLATRWAPWTMAATHLGTLGFIGAVMLGALYQMLPVVAGRPVPHARLAHAVHALFAAGVALLVMALATGELALLRVAPLVLLAALALFLGPVGVALVRAPTRSLTVWGMRIAVSALAALATLGIVMALARAGDVEVGGDWLGWVSAHAALGGIVCVGGLITAVSWQVVPMFYLTPPLPRWSQRATVGALALALVAVPCALIAGGGAEAVAACAAPAAVMVWWVHPVVTLRAIRRRKRRRVDGSVRFWIAGLVVAPLVPVLGAGALFADDGRWGVALGWCVVWGWAGLIAHGMLTRIVPFLVWFHRYAALVGRVPVPSMRALLPDWRIRVALALHAAAVGIGGLAIATGSPLLARGTGVLLGLTGLVLIVNLIHTLRRRPT